MEKIHKKSFRSTLRRSTHASGRKRVKTNSVALYAMHHHRTTFSLLN